MARTVLNPPDAAPAAESAPASQRVRLPAKRRLRPTAAWLTLPAIAFLAVFFVYPLWGLLLRSLNSDGDESWSLSAFSFDHYREAFGDSTYWLMFRSTIDLALISTVITVVMAYPVAYFMTRAPRRIVAVMTLAVMFPYFTSILIRLYAFTQILSPIGLNRTTTGAVIGMVAYLLPYMIVMLYAAMNSVDSNLGLAARTMGASPRRAFMRVFFPLTRAGLIAATLFVFVVSLGTYITPAILGSTTNQVVSTYIQQKVNLYQWGVASAMGISLLIITLVLFAFSGRGMRTTGGGAGSQKGVSARQNFRWTRTNIALGAWSGLSIVFLLAPLVIVVWASFTSASFFQLPPDGYSLRWYREVFSDSEWLESAWLSVKIAFLTALISTLLGLLAAYGLVRGRIRFDGALKTFFYLPLIVPVVLVGASLFGFEVRLRLNGTLIGYVIGHVIMALPIAVIILCTALASTSANIEKAARTLGASSVTAFRRVTLPTISASLGATALVSFLVSWDEPVVAMMLSRNEETLPVKYLQFLQQQILPTMAAVGTLLMLATVIGFLISAAGFRLAQRAWRSAQRRREEAMTSHE